MCGEVCSSTVAHPLRGCLSDTDLPGSVWMILPDSGVQ